MERYNQDLTFLETLTVLSVSLPAGLSTYRWIGTRHGCVGRFPPYVQPQNVKARLWIRDDVFPAGRLKGHEISKVALFVGTASCSPTMPARRSANIQPLGLRECCKLGDVSVRGPRGTGDAKKDEFSVVSRHLPTSQGLLCE